MTNDTDKLKDALYSANDICRTFYSVIERDGHDTDWIALYDAVSESLKLQHRAIHPEYYDEQVIKRSIDGDSITNSSYDEFFPEIPMNGKIDWNELSTTDLYQTMDAQVWATEFCSMFEDIYGHKIDDEWMHGWFANSIMCGYDHQSWKRDKEYIYILKTCGGDILKVFHWEPTEKDVREEYVKHYPEDMIGKNYNIWDYIRLFRWSRSYGLTEMNGDKSDTQYDWKAVNQ
jgi:hypothetical protein